jgi:hypothetical protein
MGPDVPRKLENLHDNIRAVSVSFYAYLFSTSSNELQYYANVKLSRPE